MLASAGPSAALAGLAFGLSLIVAFGAQNTFVLRQGVLRAHVLDVVIVCVASDVVLIAAGVGGAGAALKADPQLLTPVRILGAAFLLAYAALAVRRVRRAPPGQPVTGGADRPSRGAVLGASLAFTWLNPAVYVDTVVVLGAVAGAHGDQRWWFAAGAGLASTLWFTGLGFGARLLTPLFGRPIAWRALDAFVAVTMVLTAWRVMAVS
ncbi:MAG: LysE/ArgO family amino acid transporter [Solirubrobacteraceae bacterium]|jgi:L-lysine exporter family protein LysE/ArgO